MTITYGSFESDTNELHANSYERLWYYFNSKQNNRFVNFFSL